MRARPTTESRHRRGHIAVLLLLLASLVLAACGTAGSDAGGGDQAGGGVADGEAGDGAEEPAGERSAAERAASADYFDGQNLTLVVPFGPGGSDNAGRFIMEWLGNVMPQLNAAVVMNEPGGGGSVGWNNYANRTDRDGLTLVMGSSTPHSNWLYGATVVDYDLADMEPLMAIPTGNMMYARSDSGITGPEDLVDPDLELFFPGNYPLGGDLYKSMTLDLLDANVQKIWGYDGSGAQRIAVEQGEANVAVQSTSDYLANVRPLIEAGDALPLLSLGQLDGRTLVRDEAMPDYPHIGEVYESIHGEPPSGMMWDSYIMQTAMVHSLGRTVWVHGDAPEEALEGLRAAVEALAENEEFHAAGEETMGGYPLLRGQELVDLVRLNLYEAPDELVEWLSDYVRENYDVELTGE